MRRARPHLRNVAIEADRCFHESEHLDGSADMVAIVEILLREERTAAREISDCPVRGREGRRWSPVGMTDVDIHEGPIWRLTRSLEIRCRGGRSNETLAHLAAGGLDLAGADSLFVLACRCHESKDRAKADAVLGALVRLAGDDELAAMAVLVALRPALLVLSRRLIGVGIDPAVAQSDVVATAYERVLALATAPQAHVARAIISSSWDRLRWSLRAEQRCALRDVPLSFVGDVAEVAQGNNDSASGLAGGCDLRSVLTDAVAAGVISTTAAQIVFATRAQGTSFRTLACGLHKGEAALRKTRQRAESMLMAKGGGPGERGTVENAQEAP